MPRFRRLVVESTGLADPFPILSTVQADPVLRHHFRLGNVITTVDAVNGMAQLARQPECTKQVAVADRLVLTKTDLADTDTRRRAQRAPAPAQSRRRRCGVPPRRRSMPRRCCHTTCSRPPAAAKPHAAGSRRRWPRARTSRAHDRNRHDETIHAFAFTFDGPLDWTLFGLWLTMLLNRHGEKLLRVKGILNVAGSPAPVAVHGVQHLVHPPIHMAAWPDADRRSRLVFIVDGLDRGLIERSLRAFLRLGSSALSPAAA